MSSIPPGKSDVAASTISRQDAASIARNTIVMLDAAPSYTPERVNELLTRQREDIALRILGNVRPGSSGPSKE